MKKTYEAGTTQGYLMTGLLIKGDSRAIKFNDGRDNPVELKCRYTTSDKDVQDAIEGTKLFKDGFINCIPTVGEVISEGLLDTSEELPKLIENDPEKIVTPVKKKADVKPVVKKVEPKTLKYKNIQQVAKYLEDYKGVDITTLTTPDAIKESAKEHNLLLPNIK